MIRKLVSYDLDININDIVKNIKKNILYKWKLNEINFILDRSSKRNVFEIEEIINNKGGLEISPEKINDFFKDVDQIIDMKLSVYLNNNLILSVEMVDSTFWEIELYKDDLFVDVFLNDNFNVDNSNIIMSEDT